MSAPDNDKTDWLNRWQNNNIGFHLEQINPNLVEFWPALSAQPGEHVFVPLCGKSLDMLWLQQQKLQVSGAELSPLAVESFFEENNLPVQTEQRGHHKRCYTNKLEIFLGDFFALPSGIIDARHIYDRASLIAIPPGLQPEYIEQLINIAPNVEKMLLSTLAYDTLKMQGPPFSTSRERVQQLFEPYFHIELLVEKELIPSERFRKRGLDIMTDYVFKLERLT